ncbi:LacI family transcriptional regulator [Vibrio sp. JC009]|uniref:LacI family DNA-binding transcriptional regulator n=1 Tax=Vibrio sp. JC009 TaxID=2912314 RepID=UPI0023B0EFDE|nr:LacI family DNA-binding transcriptional regulator [Vibrio sp. JC009]WED24628.1 LacI family transcriptional regulator [Vibrio sp. JC009]
MSTEDIKKATIHEAARIAGVSIASVSRALNNKPGISEKTRKKILDICRDLDYVPSSSARELSGSHKNTIAISLGPFDTSASRYLGMLWPALSSALRNKGKNLLPVKQGDSVDFEQIGGAILLGVAENDERLKVAKENNLPAVCIGMVEGAFWVAPDDFNGTRTATEYLINKGKKNLAFVTPVVYGDAYQFRYQGFMSVMASNGLPIKEIRTGPEPLCEIAAYRDILNMDKESLEKLDGFVCECDETAIGVVSALKDRGYQLPDDFSVVGYDHLPGVSKGLTTIKQDLWKIAERVSDLLEAASKGEDPRGSIIPVTLIEGETA